MPDTVTVTGDVGPGLVATSIVITDVTEVNIDTEDSLITITGRVGAGSMIRKHEFDIKDQNTVTVTKSGYDWTITVAA
jgi:hypothetical protein